MKGIKRSFIAIGVLLFIAAMALTYVKASWSQRATAESGLFKAADIGFDINIGGANSDPAIADLGEELISGNYGTITLSITNTGTISENVTISTVSPVPGFLELTINDGCSIDMPVGGTCEVVINWQILNTDSAGGLPFSVSFTADVNHGGWQIQKIVEIKGVIALPTPTPTLTETATPTETPTPTETATLLPYETETPTATDEVVIEDPLDTETPTLTSTTTDTVTPTETETPTATPTDTVEPTETETPVPTDTPEPPATDTSVPTEEIVEVVP